MRLIYPKRIKNIMTAESKNPQTIRLVFLNTAKRNLRRPELEKGIEENERHGHKVIYVDHNDFDENDQIKPECKNKYQTLTDAGPNVQIIVNAHGGGNKYPRAIYSDPLKFSWRKLAYVDYEFNCKVVANLIRLIEKAQCPRQELAKQWLQQHLDIQLEICQGQEFGERLFDELHNQSKRNYTPLCSIITAKSDVLCYYTKKGSLDSKTMAEYKLESKKMTYAARSRILLGVAALAAATGLTLALTGQNEAALIMCLIATLALTLSLAACIAESSLKLNSDEQVRVDEGRMVVINPNLISATQPNARIVPIIQDYSFAENTPDHLSGPENYEEDDPYYQELESGARSSY